MRATSFWNIGAASLVAALTSGCGARAHAVPVVATQVVDRENPWPEYELTGEGFHARFPSEPFEMTWTPFEPQAARPFGVRGHAVLADDGWYRLGCARTAPLDFASSLSLLDRIRRASSLANGAFRGPVQRSAAKRLSDYDGETLVGRDEKGNAQIAVVYRLGDGAFMAWVTGHGDMLDRNLASRFFDSLRLTVPWHVRAFPELGLALALPAVAPEMPGSNETDFPVGGVDQIAYSVAIRSVPAGVEPFAHLDPFPSDAVVVSSQTIEHDGMPGRDFVVKQGERYVRFEFFFAKRRVYRIALGSRSLARLDDDDAKRFFGSLRVFTG